MPRPVPFAIGAALAVVASLASIAVALSVRDDGVLEAAAGRIPDVARVSCLPDGARLDAAAVRPGQDGVRFLVRNDASPHRLRIRPAAGGSATELLLGGGFGPEATVALAPGAVRVACVRAGAPAEPTAPLVVVDPLELWVSPEPECDDERQADLSVPFRGVDEDPADTLRRSLLGLGDADAIAKPGYPGTEWHGDMVVVLRDGHTIGRVTRAQDHGTWTLAVRACAGSGLLRA
jgi:hypothetical protein